MLNVRGHGSIPNHSVMFTASSTSCREDETEKVEKAPYNGDAAESDDHSVGLM